MNSKFAQRWTVAVKRFSCAIALMAISSGTVSVYAQTPSVSVRGVTVRANRGGSLALDAPPNQFLNLKSSWLSPTASTSQVQMSWGGASAPAPRLFTLAAVGQNRTAKETPRKDSQTTASLAPPDDATSFELMYENFRRTYRLGPTDEIAVRVRLEPEYSIERAKISPDGRVFHPLLGDIVVGGLTVEQLTKKLTQDLLRYIKQPEVSVQLLEAKSAKIGVLGEVARPGILVMGEPMTVLDAITQAGGFARTGSRSNVSLVRAGRDGRYQTLNVDIKKLLAGKADAEENLPLQPGDTVIVHGNFLKKLEYVTALTGFTQFLTFLAISR